jgi:hypothetical protein
MAIKIAIIKSNYIPWKGFFDSIQQVDVFVFYDEMQLAERYRLNLSLIKSTEATLLLIM